MASVSTSVAVGSATIARGIVPAYPTYSVGAALAHWIVDGV
jgi:hypothetical protein